MSQITLPIESLRLFSAPHRKLHLLSELKAETRTITYA